MITDKITHIINMIDDLGDDVNPYYIKDKLVEVLNEVEKNE